MAHRSLDFQYPHRWPALIEVLDDPARREEWLALMEDRDRQLEDFLIGETVVFDQLDEDVTVNASDDYPVRSGGTPIVVAQVTTAPTSAVTITLYRNGSSFTTLVIPIGETQVILKTDEPFTQFDRARTAVTTAGSSAVGLVVVWWF